MTRAASLIGRFFDLARSEISMNAVVSFRSSLLKTSDSIHLVHVDEISFCEADGGYTHFHANHEKDILVSKPLSEYEEMLAEYGFFRVHKSYLVNLQKVLRFEKEDGGQLVMEGEVKVPVASRKREQLFELLERITK